MKLTPRSFAASVFCFILCLSGAAATAQESRRRAMTFDDVLALKTISDAQVSPDGKWVAFVVKAADMKENAANADVWLVSTAPGGEPVRLTTSKKNDNQPRWSPDGRRLAFLSAREERAQVFLISPFGGEAERLTESKTGVQAFQWSPDGRQIAYVSQQELTPDEERRQKERDDAIVVDKNFKFSRVWVIDVATRKARELVKSDYVASDPQWSPDGKQIAYVTVPTPKADDGRLTDIWTADVATGKTRKVVENEGPDTNPRWSPDGQQIAYLSRDARGGLLGQTRLTVVSQAGGPSRAVAASSYEYQPGAPVWSRDGLTIYFVAPVRTTTHLFSVPAAGGEVKQLTRGPGVMGAATLARDNATISFTRASLEHPADVYAAKVSAPQDAARLTDHNPQVRDLALGRGEVVRWKSKDGTEVEGILLYPVSYEAGKHYPLVTLVHGGPAGVWAESFPGSYGNYGHVWAGKGWAVFYPNVRGSSGYGEKFLLSNVRDWGGGDFQDIQSGIDHLIAKGVADPDKLAQSGWSYGGYMTAWTITQTNRFKAAMVGAGITNLFSMYSTNDLPGYLAGYFGAEPYDDLEAYSRVSAMTHVRRAKTPTLIMHGAEDRRVPPGQAQELYMGLRKSGAPVEMVLYPREPHSLQEPRHQLDKMRREYAWFSKHVLGVEVTDAPVKKEEAGEKKGEDKSTGN